MLGDAREDEQSMQYGFMPKLMWAAFRGTFKKALSSEWNVHNAGEIMKNAHKDYKRILSQVDEFEKGNRFATNILSCSMFTAVLMNLAVKPTVEQARNYYRKAMSSNFFMQYAAKHSNSYTPRGREALKADAAWSQRSTNPYDWKFTVEDGETINQYTATFYTCGICHLMTKWGFAEYIPAMCAFDYDMAAMNDTEFTRAFTLASGGPYCDCHYHHRAGQAKRSV